MAICPGGCWMGLAGSGRLILGVRIHDYRHSLQKNLSVSLNLNFLICKANRLNYLRLKISKCVIACYDKGGEHWAAKTEVPPCS